MSNNAPQASQTPQAKYRKDYTAPAYLVDTVALDFDIRANHTDVSATMSVKKNPAVASDQASTWALDGRAMKLLSISIDGQALEEGGDYELSEQKLTLKQLPESFTLTLKNRIEPDANTALEGFYRSGDILTTQCESNGFSRITYFPDRPDVLSRYRVTLTADAKQYPILLANGDCVAQGAVADEPGRHYATWEDPYPKPCYLFACVAGDLAQIEDQYQTQSGRDIAIRFYTDHGNENLCDHAIDSLKKAMAWDERVYGLEYDLDTYMVVAVGSFNMGAMENKGLNIFNTSCILASADTATDRDFVTVRDVVAHEYFHNYTGNRVTCRDWFQLSLKESLTVFREQQFAADHDSPGVTRIDEARVVRNVQFPEDAGPTAHPVRPESYIEMNNFYTITIYQKGAEVIRMMHRILGDAAFNQGVRHYLHKHDGQAVTIEDFVCALEESSGTELNQFQLWYSQAGTPIISTNEQFDADTGRYQLTLKQSLNKKTGAEQGGDANKPMHIPVACKLFGANGEETTEPQLLQLREAEQTWEFDGFTQRPTPSLLRGFSAPVKLQNSLEQAQLIRLMHNEDDAFARWEASQQLLLNALISDVENPSKGASGSDKPSLIQAFTDLLANPPEDRALLAEMLTLPTESYLAEQFEVIDINAVLSAHSRLQSELAQALAEPLQNLLDASQTKTVYRFTPEEVGRRRIVAICLQHLAAAKVPGIEVRCLETFQLADNMTDTMAALNAIRDLECRERNNMLDNFAERWQEQPLVMDKWFSLHASSRIAGAFEHIQSLTQHPKFSLQNPNRVRALLGSFARANLQEFHRDDGAGYKFIADQVLALNVLNPQVAARLAGCFSQWRRFDGVHRDLMQAQLQRIKQAPSLCADVFEIIEKSLA